MTDSTPALLVTKPTWLLSQVSAQAHRLLTQALDAADARGYHYRLLAALAEAGPASQASLGRRTGIDRSDVVASLNELADRGLASRSPDPDDARRNAITITRAGRAYFHRLDQILTNVQDELLAPLTSAERDTLVALLTRLLEHHNG